MHHSIPDEESNVVCMESECPKKERTLEVAVVHCDKHVVLEHLLL